MQSSRGPRKWSGYHRREGAGVRLLLYEELSGEFLYHAALAIVLYEGVVLLGCTLGKRLEPVCVVGNTILVGPLLHTFGYGVGDGAVELGTIVDNVDKLLVDVSRQILVHLGTVEDLLAIILRGALDGRYNLYRLLLGSAGYCIESLIGHNKCFVHPGGRCGSRGGNAELLLCLLSIIQFVISSFCSVKSQGKDRKSSFISQTFLFRLVNSLSYNIYLLIHIPFLRIAFAF